MKLPILYKRTTTGATQSWEIEIEEDKFRTISGQLDGKKITNNWTTCEGKNVGKKNETSGAEQATKEAEAKHQKKRDKGYRLDVDNIDVKKFYTPMLAQDFKPNRLEAAKGVAKTFIKDRVGDRLGLIVFAGESYIQCPTFFCLTFQGVKF